MKKNIIKTIYYGGFVFSVIFAILSIYGFFTLWYVPSHQNNTVTQYVLFPTVASLKYVFLCLCAVIIAALVFIRKPLENNGIFSKGYCQIVKEKLSPINVFIFISAIISVLSVIFVISHKEIVWDYFLPRIESPQYDAFMDFFNHISYVRDPSKVYFDMTHACFPPLAYIFYYALSIFLPTDATSVHLAWNTQYYAQIVYIVYVILCVITLVFLIRAILKKIKICKFTAVCACIIISNVFVFEVLERGNSVLIVALLLLSAILLKDSEKAYCRELALLCIAVATGFKIYPAIFGILYLMEKRYKEALRLTLYGLFLSFAPFVFFGGIDGMVEFFKNQMAVQSLTYDSLYSVVSSVRYFADEITGDPLAYDKLATALQIVFIAINFIAILNNSLKQWEKVMILCALIAFAPAWSGGYTSIFFVIPMVMLFADTHKNFGAVPTAYRCYAIFISICFGLLFALNMFVLPNGFALKAVNCLPMYAINISIIIRSLVLYIVSLKKRFTKRSI